MCFVQGLHAMLNETNLDPKEIEKAKAGQVGVQPRNMCVPTYVQCSLVSTA